jgi:hypothetical protein
LLENGLHSGFKGFCLGGHNTWFNNVPQTYQRGVITKHSRIFGRFYEAIFGHFIIFNDLAIHLPKLWFNA